MKWNPKDQVTMFDLMPNSVDSMKNKVVAVNQKEVETSGDQSSNVHIENGFVGDSARLLREDGE